MHTAVYTTRIRPRTRVYVYKGRVHGLYGPSTQPKKAVYTAVHGCVTCRAYGRVRAVSASVHGSVRAMCTAVFGRVHWPCTLPFSAVYIARTRPCNGPCTRPLHGIRSVYAAVYTARVDEHVYGCVWDVYMTVYMARYSRVHGPRP